MVSKFPVGAVVGRTGVPRRVPIYAGPIEALHMVARGLLARHPVGYEKESRDGH